jgi:hypothetical protein
MLFEYVKSLNNFKYHHIIIAERTFNKGFENRKKVFDVTMPLYKHLVIKIIPQEIGKRKVCQIYITNLFITREIN